MLLANGAENPVFLSRAGKLTEMWGQDGTIRSGVK
jgi:hypothetical protein